MAIHLYTRYLSAPSLSTKKSTGQDLGGPRVAYLLVVITCGFFGLTLATLAVRMNIIGTLRDDQAVPKRPCIPDAVIEAGRHNREVNCSDSHVLRGSTCH